MKQDIHPKYDTITVTCGCGNTFETKSTVDSINVEICSACHPFYTGKQKLVDTAGRVDRFKARLEASAAKKQTTVSKPKKDKEVVAPAEEKALDEKLAEIKTELTEETIESVPETTPEVTEAVVEATAETEEETVETPESTTES